MVIDTTFLKMEIIKVGETISMITNTAYGLFGIPMGINKLKDILKKIIKMHYGQLGMQMRKNVKKEII